MIPNLVQMRARPEISYYALEQELSATVNFPLATLMSFNTERMIDLKTGFRVTVVGGDAENKHMISTAQQLRTQK